MVWILLVFLASLLNSFWFSQENWGLLITEYTQLVWLVEEDTGQNFLGKKKRTIFRCRTPEIEEWLGIYRLPRSSHTRRLEHQGFQPEKRLHRAKDSQTTVQQILECWPACAGDCRSWEITEYRSLSCPEDDKRGQSWDMHFKTLSLEHLVLFWFPPISGSYNHWDPFLQQSLSMAGRNLT